MKKSLFVSACGALLSSFVWVQSAVAADPKIGRNPIQGEGLELQAQDDRIEIWIGGKAVGKWILSPNDYPKSLSLPVGQPEGAEICFASAERRACSNFAVDEEKILALAYGGVTRRTQIKAVFDRPPARFSAAYQDARRGKVTAEIPEPYELVNIAIAMTRIGMSDDDLVYKESKYYRDVLKHFSRHRNHPLVLRIGRDLDENRGAYFPIKMNAFSIAFDEKGIIRRSDVYDRTGFAGSYQNEIVNLIDDLNSFSKESEFRKFYAKHRAIYRSQESFFKNDAMVQEMSKWLKSEFPSAPIYDGVRIVFSPLVGYNQSLTTIEADGYIELQPHVNFPYHSPPSISRSGSAIVRSSVLFTEMNHGFINPISLRYEDKISLLFADRQKWADDRKAAKYYSGQKSVFDEYMNWALVSLYYKDKLSKKDFEIANRSIVENMTNGRGFVKFAEFDAELLRLYVNRKAGSRVEDLYPALLNWVSTQ